MWSASFSLPDSPMLSGFQVLWGNVSGETTGPSVVFAVQRNFSPAQVPAQVRECGLEKELANKVMHSLYCIMWNQPKEGINRNVCTCLKSLAHWNQIFPVVCLFVCLTRSKQEVDLGFWLPSFYISCFSSPNFSRLEFLGDLLPFFRATHFYPSLLLAVTSRARIPDFQSSSAFDQFCATLWALRLPSHFPYLWSGTPDSCPSRKIIRRIKWIMSVKGFVSVNLFLVWLLTC